VVICGAPYLDNVPKQNGHFHPVLKLKLGLRKESPYILLATSGPGNSISLEHHKVVIQNVMELSRLIPQIQIIAKLHRKDSLEHYNKIRAELTEDRLLVVPYGMPGIPDDIFDWLQGCRLLLTGASTTAIEAMIMKVPVISMDFKSELLNVNFIRSGATMHVTSKEQLIDTIYSYLGGKLDLINTEKSVHSFLKKQFYALDGQSSKRAGQEILKNKT
jgi:predicted glycosyltransferase